MLKLVRILAMIVLPFFAIFQPAGATASNRASSSAQKKVAGKKTSGKKTGNKSAANKRGQRAGSKQAKNAPRARGRMVRKVVVVNGRRKVIYVAQSQAHRAPPPPSAGDRAGLSQTRDPLDLKSNVALVVDPESAKVLLEKNSGVALPIASITKLMTALVVLDARQDMNEMLEITEGDIDHEKNTRSRLRIGSRLTRADLMHIALMSSENRAASALGRNYPGGTSAFVTAMNTKARELGMNDTRYVDASGLSSRNVSSASDLAKLVIAASRQPIIRQYSTDTQYVIDTGGHVQQYGNTNSLVKSPEWDIKLQKTGYISEAGRCLVMQAKIKGREIVMVFLDSKGRLSRLGDASRVRNWLITGTAEAAMPES